MILVTLNFVFVEIYAKVGQNSILQARPSVVHFTGFQVGEKFTRSLVSTIFWTYVNLIFTAIRLLSTGRNKSIEIDHRKANRLIDNTRY